MTSIQATLGELSCAWKFVCATRRRRFIIVAPVLINLMLWLAMFPAVYWFATWVTSVSLPSAAWATVLSILAGVFAVLASIILAVFVFVAVTAVIGAPFYSLLAGDVLKSSNLAIVNISWLKEIWQSLAYTLKLGMLFVAVQLILVIFNIVPGVGTAMHAVGAFVVSLLFIAMEFFGEGFSRTELAFRDRLQFLFKNLMPIASFSTVIFFLLLVPLVNLFVPPIAVVAATKFYSSRASSAGSTKGS